MVSLKYGGGVVLVELCYLSCGSAMVALDTKSKPSSVVVGFY